MLCAGLVAYHPNLLYSHVLLLVAHVSEPVFEEHLLKVLYVGLWCDAVQQDNVGTIPGGTGLMH